MDLQNNTSAWPHYRCTEDTSRSDAADKQDLCLLQVMWHKGSQSPYSLTWRSLTSSPLSRPSPRRGETWSSSHLLPLPTQTIIPQSDAARSKCVWAWKDMDFEPTGVFFNYSEFSHRLYWSVEYHKMWDVCVCCVESGGLRHGEMLKVPRAFSWLGTWPRQSAWNLIVKLKLLQRLLSAGCNLMFCKNQYHSEIQWAEIYFISYNKQVQVTSR